MLARPHTRPAPCRELVPAGAVSEEHLRRMLGEMCDPVNGVPAGQTPILSNARVPVAGFNLTFSPPKSVSVALVLADPESKAAIYEMSQLSARPALQCPSITPFTIATEGA